MSWFTDDIPEAAIASLHPQCIAYWQNAYPGMGTEAENTAQAHKSGFRVLSTHRLPSETWWVNYYEPLCERMQQMEGNPSMQSVISETEEEIQMFEKFSDF